MELVQLYASVLFLSSICAGYDDPPPPPEYKFFRVDNPSAGADIVTELIGVVRSRGLVSIIFPKQTFGLKHTFLGTHTFLNHSQTAYPVYTATWMKCDNSLLTENEKWLCEIWTDATSRSARPVHFKACDDGICGLNANTSEDTLVTMSAVDGENKTYPLYDLYGKSYFLAPIYVVTPDDENIKLFGQSLNVSRDAGETKLVTSLIKLYNWFSHKAMEVHDDPKMKDNLTDLFKSKANRITFVFHYQHLRLPAKPDSALVPIVASFSFKSPNLPKPKCYLHAVNKNDSKSKGAFISSCKAEEQALTYSMEDLFKKCLQVDYFEAATELPGLAEVRFFKDQTTWRHGMDANVCPVQQSMTDAFPELYPGGEMFGNYTKEAGGAVALANGYNFTYWFKNYYIVPQYHETGKDMFRFYYKKTCCLPTEPANFRIKVDSVFYKPGSNTTLIFFKGDYYLEYDMALVEKDPAAWLNFKPKYRPDHWPEAFVPNYREYTNYGHTFDFPSVVKDYTGNFVKEAAGNACTEGDSVCSNGTDILKHLTDTYYKGYFDHGYKHFASKPIFITTYPTNKAYLDSRKEIHVLQYHLGNLTNSSLARMVGALFLHDALNVPFEDYQCDCTKPYHPKSGGDVPNVNCKYQANGGKCAGKAHTDYPCIMHDFSTRGPSNDDTEFAFCNTTMKYLNWLKP